LHCRGQDKADNEGRPGVAEQDAVEERLRPAQNQYPEHLDQQEQRREQQRNSADGHDGSCHLVAKTEGVGQQCLKGLDDRIDDKRDHIRRLTTHPLAAAVDQPGKGFGHTAQNTGGHLKREQYANGQYVEEIVNGRPGEGPLEFVLATDVAHRHSDVGHTGANVGAHDDRNGAGQREADRGGQTHRKTRRERTRLENGRDQHADEEGQERIVCVTEKLIQPVLVLTNRLDDDATLGD